MKKKKKWKERKKSEEGERIGLQSPRRRKSLNFTGFTWVCIVDVNIYLCLRKSVYFGECLLQAVDHIKTNEK
jgi:hypothetical protein